MTAIQLANPRAPEIAALINELDRFQLSLYPRAFCYLDSPDELCAANAYFVAAYEDGVALGCGAVKYARDDCAYGEIKRMFVRGHARGRGLSKKILEKLETHARQNHAEALRLETGAYQKEAINLYASCGFTRRGAFGGYADDALSVFMEKPLAQKA